MLDVIPAAVVAEITDHLRAGCESAEHGWTAGNEEEDTLTGDLGRSLRRGWSETMVDSYEHWRWQLTYKKFRGRGAGATEKIIGADGIFQIEVEDRVTGRIFNKGLLFQSKKVGAKDRRQLLSQADKMETLVPRGSAVFEYGPRGYHGTDAGEVIAANGHLTADGQRQPDRLGNYLAMRFVPCKIGKRGLFYDAVRGTLVVPDETNGVVQFRAQLGHRFKIEVQRRE